MEDVIFFTLLVQGNIQNFHSANLYLHAINACANRLSHITETAEHYGLLLPKRPIQVITQQAKFRFGSDKNLSFLSCVPAIAGSVGDSLRLSAGTAANNPSGS